MNRQMEPQNNPPVMATAAQVLQVARSNMLAQTQSISEKQYTQMNSHQISQHRDSLTVAQQPALHSSHRSSHQQVPQKARDPRVGALQAALQQAQKTIAARQQKTLMPSSTGGDPRPTTARESPQVPSRPLSENKHDDTTVSAQKPVCVAQQVTTQSSPKDARIVSQLATEQQNRHQRVSAQQMSQQRCDIQDPRVSRPLDPRKNRQQMSAEQTADKRKITGGQSPGIVLCFLTVSVNLFVFYNNCSSSSKLCFLVISLVFLEPFLLTRSVIVGNLCKKWES